MLVINLIAFLTLDDLWLIAGGEKGPYSRGTTNPT